MVYVEDCMGGTAYACLFIVDLIMQAITVGGGALAVYGRVTAKTALK
jgi:hypothetical protein